MLILLQSSGAYISFNDFYVPSAPIFLLLQFSRNVVKQVLLYVWITITVMMLMLPLYEHYYLQCLICKFTKKTIQIIPIHMAL